MDSVLQSLLWKEWQERKRTLFVCLAWILGGVIYVTIYESALGYRTPVSRFSMTCIVYSLFMTVFLSMRVCLSEVTHQTLSFSSALPVSLPKTGIVKLGLAIFILTGPILVGALILTVLLLYGILEQVSPRSDYYSSGFSILQRPSLSPAAAIVLLGKMTCISIIQTTALFLILAVIGARRRCETHIGLLGAVLVFLWLLITPFSEMLLASEFTQLVNWVGALFPISLATFYTFGDMYGSYSDVYLADWIWVPLLLNLIILCGLAFWFSQRYGTRATFSSHRKKRGWKLLDLFSWISFSHRSEASSLIWINSRQSIPLATVGLPLAAVMATANALLIGQSDESTLTLLASNLPSGMWVVAILWATVVGSGIFAAELAPNLRNFWMSRPILIGRWFWFKYLVGLAVVLLVLDGTTIAVSWNSIYEMSAKSPHHSRDLLSWSYIACFPILHSMMYSLAVLGVCWWRKPVRGAVAAIAVFFIGSMIMESIPSLRDFDPLYVYNNLFTAESRGEFNLAHHHFPVVFTIVGMITFCTAYLASRKVQQLEV